VDNLLNFAFRPGTGKGIDWADPLTGKEIHAGVSNGKLKNDTICGITRDREGNIIILTPSGVEISRNGGESFEHTAFRIPFDSTIFYFKDVLIMPDKSLVMRYKNILARIDIDKRSVSFINTPAKNLEKRALVSGLNIDHKGRLYFEQLGGVYRLENDQLKLLWQNTLWPEYNITACFIDRNDVLWASPNAQGLIKVNLLANAFQSYNYNRGFFTDVLEQAGIAPATLPSYWFTNKRHYNFYTAYGTDSLLYLCYGRADTTSIQYNIFYRDGKKTYCTAVSY
jgi:ligand-binding sensor domain-containing protein